jgi:outer membrane protein insertion porin family
MRMTGSILVFLLMSPFFLLGQASYEGQPVSSVDLTSDPSIDVDNLRGLVTIKPGEPYSEQKVQQSIEALKKTGQFKNVDVEVKPEPEGLRVILVLEPAYYYGVLTFPGSGRFSYVRLLQVANLPEQEPFLEKDVEKARTALTNFFHTNGYFQAEVTPSTELYEKEGLTNVIFTVQLGKRAKLGRVKIEGPFPADAARLLKVTQSLRALATGASLKSGKVYTPRRLEAARSLIKRDLVKHNYLANKVQLGQPQYHPETNRADLVITVDQGPKVEVKIEGAKLSWVPFLSGRQEKKLIPIYEEATYDQDLVEEGQRNLVSFFQAKGYFDVHVQTNVQQQPDKIALVYTIDKGKRHQVGDVAFRGNQHIASDELRSSVTVQKKHFLARGKFSDKLVQNSVKNLVGVYRDRGFEEVSVTPEIVDKEPNVFVTFQIGEGPQTRVEKVTVTGNTKFDLSALTPPGGLNERPGAPYSAHQISDDRGHILATYLNHGYLGADVKSKVTRNPGDRYKVEIVYQIVEGQQVRVDNVGIVGENVTRYSFIKKTANLFPNQPLSQGDLLEAESKLYNMGVFDWASVGPRRPIKDQTNEEAVVKVHEARRNNLTYGVGFEVSRRGGNVPTGTIAVPGLPTVGLGNAKIETSEQTFVSPRGSVQYTRQNIRGLGETGAISLLVARLNQKAIATYADPQFRGSQWSSLFSMSAERTTENPLFTARLGNVSYQLERSLDRKKTMTGEVRYSFGQTKLSNLLVPELVLPQDRSVRLSTFSGTFIKDTRDKPLDAHKGLYQTTDYGVTSSIFGASADFHRLLTQTASYKPMGHGIVFANSLRLGLAKAFAGDTVPTSERFFAGGATTLRGFSLNAAGPQRAVAVCTSPTADPTTCPRITVPVGGNQLFIFNSEMRFPIPVFKNLGAVLFYDGGNVYRNISLRQFIDDYTNTVGFGLRYNTPIGPVRFDVGHNLNPVPGLKSTQFFVTLGQAF